MKKLLRKILTVVMALALTFGVVYAAPVSAEAGDPIILPVVPISSSTQDMNYRTYLSSLTDGTKLVKAYDALYTGIKAAKAQIDVENCGVTSDQLLLALNAVIENNPELFWFIGGGTTTTKATGGIATKYEPNYLFTGAALENAKTAFNKKVAEIVDSIGQSAGGYEKTKAVHDYLITHTTYDADAEYNQSAYSCLVNGKTVCAGYAKSFQLLTRALGLKCLYITGVASQSSGAENHGWNMVEIDGDYYLVDVTWDDVRENVPNDITTPDDISAVNYNYFNMTSAAFNANHFSGQVLSPDGKSMISAKRDYYAGLPATCTATAANYFEKNKDKILFVKDGKAGDITAQDVANFLLNPVDDACRIYIENMADAAAVTTAIYNLLEDAYALMDIPVATGYANSFLTVGHEICYTFLFVPGVTVHGDVNFPNQTEGSVTVRILDSKNAEVYKKVVSGLGASYIAYNLPTGNYKLCYKYGQAAEQTRSFTVTGNKDVPTENIIEEDIDISDVVGTLPIENIFTGGATQVRSSGESRYATANATADNLKKALAVDKFDTIIVACGTNFPDALAGSYLAAKKSAPILIVGGGSEAAGAADTVNYVKNNLKSGGKVYIIGGTSSVAASVQINLMNLQSATFSIEVERLSGANRYETNMKILNEAGIAGEDTLLVCDGAGYADALSASALGLPILLIDKSSGTLSQEQKNFIAGGDFTKVYVIGGVNSVPASIITAVKNAKPTIANADIKRLSGSGRYETSIKIAEEFFADAKCITIATGVNFPDGLTGGSLAYALEAPLILTNNDSDAYGYAKTFVSTNSINKLLTFGGTNSISETTISGIMGK